MEQRGRKHGSGKRPRLVATLVVVLVVVLAGGWLVNGLFGGDSGDAGNGTSVTDNKGSTGNTGGSSNGSHIDEDVGTDVNAPDGANGDGTNGENGNGEAPFDPEEPVTAEELAKVYDLVLAGGRVINPETGLDKEGMNVGISGSTIEVVTSQPLRGERVIDVTGLVVAPGFIDNMSYDPNPLGVWNKIADGVTANNAMHGGTTTHNSWYAHFERDRPPVHFGASYFYTSARNQMNIGRYDAASAEQTARLVRNAEEALNNGSLGISFSLEYVPGISPEEVMPLMDLAYEYNVPVYFHGRYSDMEEPGTNFDTLEEIIGYARASGAAVHIDHINSTGGTFSMPESLAMIEEALAEGLDITACIYPYNFWGTYLNSARFDTGWQERFRISYEDLQIAGTTERLTAETFRQYQREGKLAVAYAIPEQDVIDAIKAPYVMIGSDAILEPGHNNHPRASGTFARTIAHYVRETGEITLMEAISKMALQPAQRLEKQSPALQKKGRIAKGMDADIVVFDYATIADRSTVENPELPSTGIQYVLVEGQLALENGEVNRSVRPGKGLRSEFVRVAESAGELYWDDKLYPLLPYRGQVYVDVALLTEQGYGLTWDKLARTFAISERAGQGASAGTVSGGGTGGSPQVRPAQGTLMLERGYRVTAGTKEAELISIGERAFMPLAFLEALGTQLGITVSNEGDVWTVERN